MANLKPTTGRLPSQNAFTTEQQLSLVSGPRNVKLTSKSLGQLIEENASQYRGKAAVSVPWQGIELTYTQLANNSKAMAKSMLEMGLKKGDCVGIMAGNCYQYIEVFLGGARIGCPVVVLNNTYSPGELQSAVFRSGKRFLCLS